MSRPGDGPDGVRVLTIGRDERRLRELLGDPAELAKVLAEPYTGDPSTWSVALVEEVEGRLRFQASSETVGLSATGSVAFAPAPQDLGTEVTVALQLDGPDLAAGAMAHKVLRRAKALAETGEIPSLAHNPSGRDEPGDRQDGGEG
jgi:hypothetical protein